MTNLTINYKYNHLAGTKELTELMDQKIKALEKFIPEEAAVVCDVEFEKEGTHHNGKIHRVEANLSINGTMFRAEATEESFERAVDVVRDELNRELRSAKDKSDTLLKRGGRELKSMMIEG